MKPNRSSWLTPRLHRRPNEDSIVCKSPDLTLEGGGKTQRRRRFVGHPNPSSHPASARRQPPLTAPTSPLTAGIHSPPGAADVASATLRRSSASDADAAATDTPAY